MAKYVYLLKTSENIYKIGVANDVEKRVKQLQTGCANKIMLVDKFMSNYPFKLESVLHNKYKDLKVNGEWFYLSNEDVTNFQNECSLIESNYKCLSELKNPFI